MMMAAHMQLEEAVAGRPMMLWPGGFRLVHAIHIDAVVAQLAGRDSDREALALPEEPLI